MLDDDDISDAVYILPFDGGWVLALFSLIIVAAIIWAVSDNHDECATKKCPNGQAAELLDNRCLCVTEAK